MILGELSLLVQSYLYIFIKCNFVWLFWFMADNALVKFFF